jgi:hypothetical protein
VSIADPHDRHERQEKPTPSGPGSDPHDPETVRVHYDLSGWTFEQQADLAAELAEAEVLHTWNGDELVVTEAQESLADHVIAEVEARLGIASEGDEKADAEVEVEDLDTAYGELPDGAETTEYDLADWGPAERRAVARELRDAEVPFRWDAGTLLVPTDHEESVDALLDEVEAGDIVLDADTDDDGAVERLPFETLTTFFLAGERLARNSLDPDGLDDLLEAVDVADPQNPPYGVERGLWMRTCELAEELADALTEGDEPDHEEATEVAQELRDLLRPYV